MRRRSTCRPNNMAFLAQIPDATFRETTADFLVNRQFRPGLLGQGQPQAQCL
jgi:methyltransferase-like protein